MIRGGLEKNIVHCDVDLEKWSSICNELETPSNVLFIANSYVAGLGGC